MQIIDEFALYRDKYGLTGLSTDGTQGHTSQNGTLFTMQYLICLKDNVSSNLFHQEVERLKDVYKSCEASPGLSRRHPDSDEYDSMDNQSAILTFSALYDDGRYAKDMVKYGEDTRCEELDLSEKSEETQKWYKWARVFNFFRAPNHCWNVKHPGKFNIRAWWGRSPSLLGLSRMAAGKFCNPFLWLAVLVGQFVGAFKPVEDCDARTLPFVVWQYLKTRSLFWKLTYKLWMFILKKYYPNGIKDVYNRYYQDKSHPIIKYTKS